MGGTVEDPTYRALDPGTRLHAMGVQGQRSHFDAYKFRKKVTL